MYLSEGFFLKLCVRTSAALPMIHRRPPWCFRSQRRSGQPWVEGHVSLLCSSTWDKNTNKQTKQRDNRPDRNMAVSRASWLQTSQLTSSWRGSRCGSHQKTSLVGGAGKGWAGSTHQTALTSLCASLRWLQLSEMDKSLERGGREDQQTQHDLWPLSPLRLMVMC